MGLTSKETLIEVQKLLDLSFISNAILDNIVYQINIAPLNMPRLYGFMHHTIAHAFTGDDFADGIAEFMMERQDRLYRGNVPEQSKIYSDIVECLEDAYNAINSIKEQVENCINVSIQHSDTDKEVEDYFRDLNKSNVILYWKQLSVLKDAAKSYANSGILPSFNKDFESYIILPEDKVHF